MPFGQDSGIGKITVRKPWLLGKLETNRERHHQVFLEAVEAFRIEATRQLNALADRISSGGRLPRVLSVPLPVPEEHLDDYTRTIDMLQAHTGETIELSEQAYSQYVNDDWGWRASFINNTVSYTAGGSYDPLPGGVDLMSSLV